MEKRRLGRNGPEVTVIGFGAWAIGGMNWGATDDEVSKRAIHEALDRGVNFIDTADVYGFGHSEELIAEVLAERGGKGDIVIATKAGSDFTDASNTDEVKSNYTWEYLVAAAERSLKRLQVDCLDVLQLHSPELSLLQQDEPWQALDTLKRHGKIRCAGLSIRSFDETVQADLLDEHKDLLDCIQVRYNLLEREAEKVLFPKALEHGIGVIVRIPLLFGLLTGKFNRESRFGDDDHRKSNLAPEKLDDYLNEFERLKPLYDVHPDETKTQVSLRFCITHPAATTAIPGAKTPQQVEDNVRAGELGPLTDKDLALLAS
jgi:aryl-alcohol dehydrogenase-like predicted oxidoreductase